MRTSATISGLYEDNVGLPLLDKLAQIYPAARVRHFFRATLPYEDERTRLILETLSAAGWTAWADKTREPDRQREFVLRLQRQYEPGDFDTLSHIELRPDFYLFGREVDGKRPHDYYPIRDADGRIEVRPRFLHRGVDFAFAGLTGEWPVVPDRVKRLLDSAGLRSVGFRPTALVAYEFGQRKELAWGKRREPWWELVSDVVLPPVSPTMDLRDEQGRRIPPGDLSNGCRRREGLYGHPELHYRTADLARAGDSDLARTFEPFAGLGEVPHDCPLVASRRFYAFCTSHALSSGWVPVRVEAD